MLAPVQKEVLANFNEKQINNIPQYIAGLF